MNVLKNVLPLISAAMFLLGTQAVAQGPDPAAAPTGVYKTDYKHRYITFSYLHQGYSRPLLRWGDWDATLNWNAEDPTKSSVSAVIKVASVDSGVEEFNGYLQGENFLDVAKYPEITFVSTKLTKTGENTGTMTGDLTIKGVTKPVSLDVTFNRAAFDMRGNKYKIGFSASGSIKRSEFGAGILVPAVSDEVDVSIEAEFESPKPE